MAQERICIDILKSKGMVEDATFHMKKETDCLTDGAENVFTFKKPIVVNGYSYSTEFVNTITFTLNGNLVVDNENMLIVDGFRISTLDKFELYLLSQEVQLNKVR